MLHLHLTLPHPVPAISPLLARDILKRKGRQVITIEPDHSIRRAIETLVTHGVGALFVVKGARIFGVLTERDILRANRAYQRLRGLTVSDLMTQEVIIGFEEDSLDYIMVVMTQKRIRHLPILAEGKITGVLSIGDVIKAKAHHAQTEIRFLKDYINGQYPS